jgi:hypothetical protein
MKKVLAAATSLAVTGSALAAGDSGTSSVGEMQVSGTHLLLMVGGLVVLGLVIWGLAKLTSR